MNAGRFLNLLECLIVNVAIAVPGHLHAITELDDVPKGCNNNPGIFRQEGSNFNVGPLWLRQCKNVCDFDVSGKVIRRKTVWYVPQICAGTEKSTITWVGCKIDTRARDCFQVMPDESDPRNHDCRKGGAGWTCIPVKQMISCRDADPQIISEAIQYRRIVSVADCAQRDL